MWKGTTFLSRGHHCQTYDYQHGLQTKQVSIKLHIKMYTYRYISVVCQFVLQYSCDHHHGSFYCSLTLWQTVINVTSNKKRFIESYRLRLQVSATESTDHQREKHIKPRFLVLLSKKLNKTNKIPVQSRTCRVQHVYEYTMKPHWKHSKTGENVSSFCY